MAKPNGWKQSTYPEYGFRRNEDGSVEFIVPPGVTVRKIVIRGTYRQVCTRCQREVRSVELRLPSKESGVIYDQPFCARCRASKRRRAGASKQKAFEF